MSKSLIDRAFEEIKKGLFDEIKPRMQRAMEEAFDQAWTATMQRQDQTPVADGRVASPPPPAADLPPGNRSKPPSNVGKRAEWGATRKVIQGAFAAHKTGGMTPKAIADWGVANGQRVAASSVRTTLQKMQKASEVRRRKDRYFPNSPPGSRIGDELPDAGPPAPEESKPNGSWTERPMPPP